MPIALIPVRYTSMIAMMNYGTLKMIIINKGRQ